MSGKRGKNDAQDAAAICEAVTRAQMRLFPSKKNTSDAFLMRMAENKSIKRVTLSVKRGKLNVVVGEEVRSTVKKK